MSKYSALDASTVRFGFEENFDMPTFHPGVDHKHTPSGRWADVQANPNSPGAGAHVIALCKLVDPDTLIEVAIVGKFGGKLIAQRHLAWYLTDGKGADFIEDANIRKMLFEDTGVQFQIGLQIPRGQTSGTFAGSLKIEQSHYTDQDLRFAFGAIDILDFEVDFAARTIHAWFQDRYEWHPVYPGLYTFHPGDVPRETNCVHAALVEMQSSGARDFWMKGEAWAPLHRILNAMPLASTGWF